MEGIRFVVYDLNTWHKFAEIGDCIFLIEEKIPFIIYSCVFEYVVNHSLKDFELFFSIVPGFKAFTPNKLPNSISSKASSIGLKPQPAPNDLGNKNAEEAIAFIKEKLGQNCIQKYIDLKRAILEEQQEQLKEALTAVEAELDLLNNNTANTLHR